MFSSVTEESSAALWAGRVLGAVVILALLADAGVHLFWPHLLARNLEAIAFPFEFAPLIGGSLLVFVVLYMLPRTSVLGAILVSAFLGSAICMHLRIGEIASPPQIICAFLAVAAWLSLYLRNGHVRAVLPLLAWGRP